jgi:hypothetical protein
MDFLGEKYLDKTKTDVKHKPVYLRKGGSSAYSGTPCPLAKN